MTTQVIQSICLDLDGTLIDPKLGITSCINYALDKLGKKTLTSNELTWCIGPPLHDSFTVLMGDEDLAQQALTLYRERYSTKGIYENELYPDIQTILKKLSSSGFNLYLATSKPKVFAKTILDYLELSKFFKAVHGSELDGINADKTDLLSYIIESEQLNPETTVMVGDRKFDIIGAKNNNLASIGVLYGYGTREELSNAGCKTFVNNPSHLLNQIEKNL